MSATTYDFTPELLTNDTDTVSYKSNTFPRERRRTNSVEPFNHFKNLNMYYKVDYRSLNDPNDAIGPVQVTGLKEDSEDTVKQNLDFSLNFNYRTNLPPSTQPKVRTVVGTPKKRHSRHLSVPLDLSLDLLQDTNTTNAMDKPPTVSTTPKPKPVETKHRRNFSDNLTRKEQYYFSSMNQMVDTNLPAHLESRPSTFLGLKNINSVNNFNDKNQLRLSLVELKGELSTTTKENPDDIEDEHNKNLVLSPSREIQLNSPQKRFSSLVENFDFTTPPTSPTSSTNPDSTKDSNSNESVPSLMSKSESETLSQKSQDTLPRNILQFDDGFLNNTAATDVNNDKQKNGKVKSKFIKFLNKLF